MKVFSYFILIFAILNLNVNGQSQFIKDLFSKMSAEDKCGQMTQVSTDSALQKMPKITNPDENPIDPVKLLTAIKDKRIGSILQTPYTVATKAKTWQSIIKLIQDTALSYNLKIPVIYGIDSIHGSNYIREGTLFPQPISMAASFNVDVVEKIARITAEETRAVGIPWNFNPAVDIGRQPLWPRLWEGYGESTFVASRIAEAYVKSHQGNDLTSRSNAATCLKHYVGYGVPFNGRDRTPAHIPEYLLRELHLPPFQAGVLAGSPTVMVNSGEVNGMPGHANSFYINTILKGEMKFDGFVVSDWEDIKRLYTRDKVAQSPEEAVRRAVLAGVDMSMVPQDYTFTDICVKLVKSNDKEFMNRVDDAVLRILKVKEKLGLWSNSSLYPVESDLDKIDTDASHDQNLEVAKETVILAKNEKKSLPLDKFDNKKILVAGPSGNLLKCLNGGWTYTWQGENEENNVNFGRSNKLTLFNAIKSKIGNGEVNYKQGVSFVNNQTNDISATVELAKTHDIIILTVGENTYTESPGTVDNLKLNSDQYDLANALFALNKKVILVYLGGRPRIITEMANKANAVIVAFLPGNRGGEAIADIIFGDYNPNGKLPVTYPLADNGFVTYDAKNIEVYENNDPLALSKGGYENLYPFGHGLSYTEFRYSNLKLSSKEVQSPDGKITVNVDIQNVGQLEGKETVVLYLQDEFSSITRPVREVRGFKKISLSPNQLQTVSFELNDDHFSFINEHNQRVVEEGSFKVYINFYNETVTFNLSKKPTRSVNLFSNFFERVFSIFN